ncbi:MAG TPA: polysaccharide ABC transporter ATP-binding protein [Gemmatimonadaceae bacterium]|nr:polysaccharide ABC transporter ATP-binding protein [Gemmatimonadaceae bacterium]
MSDRAIVATDVSKKFCKALRRGLYYGAVDVLSSVFRGNGESRRLRADEFWALERISFEVARGETLGVIGENGSGKSTLLKILNGILLPDAGSVLMNGRVGALIEVGAGFNPLLTGRENVYLNGAILGMSRSEIASKFDAIVEFADAEEFLDVPVRNYSSGMTVRLGFAIAIHADLDILLVDEVLAVGDALFQYKCYDRITQLRSSGTTIVLVSHAMSVVERVCDRTLVLDHGHPEYLGDTAVAIERYFAKLSEVARSSNATIELDVKEVRFRNVAVRAAEGGDTDGIVFGRDLELSFDYETAAYAGRDLEFRVGLKLPSGVVGSMMRFRRRARASEHIALRVRHPRLVPGTYFVNIAACPVGADVHLGGLNNAATFHVLPETAGDYRFEYGQEYMVLFDYTVNGEQVA